MVDAFVALGSSFSPSPQHRLRNRVNSRPETREQACWCHKLANVLDKLPQRLQPRAKRALHEMIYAACRTDCAAARSRFEAEYQAKYPRAVESLTANWERLVTFFDSPPSIGSTCAPPM